MIITEEIDMKKTMTKIAKVLNWLFTPIPEAYPYLDYMGFCEYGYY